MRSKRTKRCIAIALVLVVTWMFLSPLLTSTRPTEAVRVLPESPLGSEEMVEQLYADWLARHENRGGDRRVEVGFGWSKGLSSELSRARGMVRFDLISGKATVELRGFDEPSAVDVWIVDNRPGPGHSVRPERGDALLWVGTLEPGGPGAVRTLEAELPELPNTDVDLVVVTRHGESPIGSGLLFGAPPLFQRMYTAQRLGRIGDWADSGGRTGARSVLAKLVEAGSALFFEETFDGNGRTCGTCHPAENDFTIDPSFIATLPSDDPLFVAEFLPALAENFEKPLLMREVGLILENLDGFGDLETRFVMRGVPHTLALGTSLLPAPDGADGTTLPPDERTGWSGDGAPGSGTLREFAIGAVRQHFTKTLARAPGADFRFPTDEELDALEAFQLSLGRDSDPDLTTLVLRGAVARRGLEIFLATDSEGGTVAAGKCTICHENGGATASILPGGFNFNFDTGVEALEDTPAELVDEENRRPDGGFGLDPHPDRPGAFGNGTFNTPPVIEAADTGPFFHDNSIGTIEAAVDFYDGEAFAQSPAGQLLAAADSGGIAIELEVTDVEAVAAFLRVLNALENLRSADVFATRARSTKKFSPARASIVRAIDDLDDAAEVLRSAGLHAGAVRAIERAIFELRCAAKLSHRHARGKRIDRALERIAEARGELIE